MGIRVAEMQDPECRVITRVWNFFITLGISELPSEIYTLSCRKAISIASQMITWLWGFWW
jgi:hypothetical protein